MKLYKQLSEIGSYFAHRLLEGVQIDGSTKNNTIYRTEKIKNKIRFYHEEREEHEGREEEGCPTF